MNGAAFFFAFALVAFPAAAVIVLGLRRKIRLWLWLERQWDARQAAIAKRKQRKPEQVLLFPEFAAETVNGPAPIVNDWSMASPRKAVRP